ncbi:hypothetical protein R1flu_024608 [Riccia fluitans]|uniref:Ribosomal protein S14 n=1 Tax=Riccia fluitans TaxID=41844 RepID=A0ABD1XYC0_9MARC
MRRARVHDGFVPSKNFSPSVSVSLAGNEYGSSEQAGPLAEYERRIARGKWIRQVVCGNKECLLWKLVLAIDAESSLVLCQKHGGRRGFIFMTSCSVFIRAFRIVKRAASPVIKRSFSSQKPHG